MLPHRRVLRKGNRVPVVKTNANGSVIIWVRGLEYTIQATKWKSHFGKQSAKLTFKTLTIMVL